MAATSLTAEDLSVYCHLSEDELLHIALEQSFYHFNRSSPVVLAPPLHSPVVSAPPLHSSVVLDPPPHSPVLSAVPPNTHVAPPSHVCVMSAPPSPVELAPPLHSPEVLAPPPQVNVVQSQPAPPAPNSLNPPTSLAMMLYRRQQEEPSPVQSLILSGDVAALMDLIADHSPSLTKPNSNGWMSLHDAAYYGQLHCLRMLIQAYPDLVNSCTTKGQSALTLAVWKGHLSCAELLLKHGANPEICNIDRETALFTACEHSKEPMVELLLRCGAQVNRVCKSGNSPLHEACCHGNIELCKTLQKAGAKIGIRNIYGIQPLFTAAQNGHRQLVRLLFCSGADINAQALDGASPLFEASKNGHVSVVELLLSLKADPNRATKSGLLPLHIAVQNNHQQIVSLLVPYTSRVRVRQSGISPLHIAAEWDHDELLQQLIWSGFEVNSMLSWERSCTYTDRRSTALYFSVFNGNLSAAKALLEAGADPELDVFRPLLVAVRMGWTDLVALLLQYGADVHAQIPDCPSAFPPALQFGLESLPILKLLLDHGCDPTACFDCCYGSKIHPPPPPKSQPLEELQSSRNPDPERIEQFCEAISCPSLSHLTGPVVSVLLDYVGQVQLCSKLFEVLQPCSLWPIIKLKTSPPQTLMQLCRLLVRRLLGLQRLRMLHTLPLPVRLIHFLQHHVDSGLQSL